MCYNCGCDVADDNMGYPDMTGSSLTEKSFEEMAKAWSMTVEEAKRNVLRLLEKQLKTKQV